MDVAPPIAYGGCRNATSVADGFSYTDIMTTANGIIFSKGFLVELRSLSLATDSLQASIVLL